MAPHQRPRACEPCHSIKIKCELGSTGGAPPCERCVRLGKDCTVSKPRRNKDKVAELEARVEALTKMLEAQGLSPEGNKSSTASTSNGTGSSQYSKKRRLENDLFAGIDAPAAVPDQGASNANPPETPQFNHEGISVRVDQLVPRDVQRQIVDKYVHVIVPKYPFVQLEPGTTLESLRSSKPLLCQAILSTQGPEYLSDEAQEELIVVMMNVYGNAIINAGEKSLEVVQAIQVAVSWFNSPRTHKHVNVYQLIHIAADMAADIGIGGINFNPLPKTITGDDFEPDRYTHEARRAWLVCYLLSASITLNMRRPSSNQWSPYHEECLNILSAASNPSPHDVLLTTIIRGEKLCETIALANHLTDMQSHTDITSPTHQYILKDLTAQLQTWRTTMPTPSIASQVTLWDSLALIHLHEPVLHTATNKTSFAGPFLAERLAETDFPAPSPVTQAHAHSLLTLKSTIHGLLTSLASLPSRSMLAEPGLIYLPRGAFSFYLLMKLYIAVTGPGNTFSAVISPDELQVEAHVAKMRSLATRARDVHGVFVQKKILIVVDRIRDWFVGYNRRMGLETKGVGELYEGGLEEAGRAGVFGGWSGEQESVVLPEIEGAEFGWDEFLAMPDQGLDFGFGDLFAEDFGFDRGWS
ncbi:hypothetical protein MBLNU230_g0668t1 [Neophaeotheca triangularis]